MGSVGAPVGWLVDLDVNVGNIVFYKKLLVLGGHDGAFIVRERFGEHTYPDDGGGGRLSDVLDAEGVNASPLYIPRIQKGAELVR